MAPSVVPLSVVPNPPSGIVGRSVMLNIRGFPERALTYVWYRVSSGTLNRIAAYSVPAALQSPADIRERVFSNGSLLIPNLTLSDIGDYIVQIVNFTSGEPLMARGHLSVYAETSPGRGNDVSDLGGAFIVIVTGIYIVLAVLIVALTRGKTGRACDHPTEVRSSTSNHICALQVDDESLASMDICAQRPLAMTLSSTITGIGLDHNELTVLVLPPGYVDFDTPHPDLSGWKFPNSQTSSTTAGPTPDKRKGEVPVQLSKTAQLSSSPFLSTGGKKHKKKNAKKQNSN